MSKQVITVFGATGAQGGGLARALLRDRSGDFSVRAVTRKLASDQARELEGLGAEVVHGDLDDSESVRRALEGAYGAFCVTNFWEHFSPDKELAQTRTLAQAAREARVRHVIWSTLEDTRQRVPVTDERMPTLQGRYKVPHFDAKGEANRFFADLPTTYLYTSFYWDNLIHFGMGPKPDADGRLSFVLPMGNRKLAGIAAEDIGKCAYAIFRQKLIGKSIGIAGEHLTGAQMADALSRALERPVAHRDLSFEAYRALGFPGADDLGNMFQYYHEFEAEFCAARDVSATRSLHPELSTFAQWLQRNKARIPVA